MCVCGHTHIHFYICIDIYINRKMVISHEFFPPEVSFSTMNIRYI